MIKTLVMLSTIAGSAGYGIKEAHHTVRSSAEQYVAVYESAAQINPYSDAFNEQVSTMLQKAERLQDVAMLAAQSAENIKSDYATHSRYY
jgi:hypothetical protein|tara:strand:+ start:183 stop:452 length:270 start_codon:yes stop_codon:yes gene_type:complete